MIDYRSVLRFLRRVEIKPLANLLQVVTFELPQSRGQCRRNLQRQQNGQVDRGRGRKQDFFLRPRDHRANASVGERCAHRQLLTGEHPALRQQIERIVFRVFPQSDNNRARIAQRRIQLNGQGLIHPEYTRLLQVDVRELLSHIANDFRGIFRSAPNVARRYKFLPGTVMEKRRTVAE